MKTKKSKVNKARIVVCIILGALIGILGLIYLLGPIWICMYPTINKYILNIIESVLLVYFVGIIMGCISGSLKEGMISGLSIGIIVSLFNIFFSGSFPCPGQIPPIPTYPQLAVIVYNFVLSPVGIIVLSFLGGTTGGFLISKLKK